MKVKLYHLILSSLFSAGLAVGLFYWLYEPKTLVIREEPAFTLVSHEDGYSANFSSIAKVSLPSVVFIRSINKIETGFNREFKSVTGSGVILSQDGYIITNNHLLNNAEHIEVTLHNKRVHRADLVGFDEYTDLALLKIEETSLRTRPFGDSDSLTVGEWVLAIGNPFKLKATVTAGIISAKARHLNPTDQLGVESYLQTDAVINPGNSGGALINTKGELIGINTAILSNSGNYEGFSFAIPSSIVQKVYEDIRDYGSVQRAWIGATIAAVDNDIAESLGLQDIEGVIVRSVTKGGAAYSTLTKGDVITHLNKVPVNSPAEFNGILARFRPGEYINVQFIRGKKPFNSDVILQNHLNTTDFISIRRDKEFMKLGIELRNLSGPELDATGSNGLKVISVTKGSIAAKSNIEPGYIITHVNQNTLNDVNELLRILKSNPETIIFDGFYQDYPGRFPYKITF
jgi:Do/DeqQ family serine protease